MRWLVLLIASLGATDARAWQAADARAPLLQDWAALNAACRGGRGGDPRTLDACARRDVVDRRLIAEGWCYGRPGDAGFQRAWRRCTDDPRGRP
ncbi:hypothetical protein ASF22_09505 [Methylobacterium sp. Leaf87]|uniref:hypothetical protein n=1 Tax=unclassified Methylobacterium TaxID=2615210 RepID=UPI0006F82F2C|nr:MULTISPECIES: hypothetical protein [unclassified Methylobacterium]KQO56755.1 hypothetical protein ASF22_09505 [Methylobacterium sp. Leaf87]